MELQRVVDQILERNSSKREMQESLFFSILDLPPAPSIQVMEALASRLSYSVQVLEGRLPRQPALTSIGKTPFWCMPQLPEQVKNIGGISDYARALGCLGVRYATPWEFLCWAVAAGPRCGPPGYFKGVTSFYYDEDGERVSNQYWPYYDWEQRLLRFERMPVTYCDVLQLVTTL